MVFLVVYDSIGADMEPQYLPVEKRRIDFQYRDHLQRILENGRYTKHPHQPVGRKVLLTLEPMCFDLSNGVPIITERYMPFVKSLSPIGEMLAFVNGVRTNEELEKWGVKYWRTWTTPEKCALFGLPPGDLGDGSYGAGFHAPEYIWEDVEGHPDGGRYVKTPFDQFYHLIQEIRDNPYIITHKISAWLPQHCLQHKGRKRKVVVAPCHGDIEVTIMDNDLILRMDQRSGDYPVGVPADILMYAALTIMIAHVTGYNPYMFIHAVHNSHIYEDQIPEVEKMIQRTPKTFGTLHLTEEGKRITELKDFRVHHFYVTGYNSHERLNIPVTE